MHDRMIRVGHHLGRWWLGVIWILAAIPTAAGTQILDWVGVAVIIPALVLNVTSGWVHGRNLCETCIDEFPLDAQEQASRHDHALRLAHFLQARRGTVAWYGLLMTGTWLGAGHPIVVGQFSWQSGFIWMCLLTTVTGRAFSVHSRLRPACPYCRRRDGGGDGVVAPTPDPAMTV
jgi:hypothetical protein